MAYHSFISLENEGLITLLQKFVNIATRLGRFEEMLFTVETLSPHLLKKTAKVKKTLKSDLIKPQDAELQAFKECKDTASDPNPLAFWRCNKKRFLMLAKLQKNYLQRNVRAHNLKETFHSLV